MALAKLSSQFRSIRDQAEAANWTVTVTTQQHFKFVPPKKEHSPVIFSGSPSDYRALRNFVARLRQRGLPIRHTPRKARKKIR